MFFFRKKKREAQEAEINAIHKELYKKIDEATKSAEKVATLLETDGTVTNLIFLATGGDHRGKK